MENRITKKVDTHLTEFKNEVKLWFDNNDCDICGKYNKSDFLKFIFDFDGISLSKDDFQKRKRVKNSVPIQIRCCAKRANGEQCTRRKKDDSDFCGTHIKGRPYGKIECTLCETPLVKKIDIWVEDIKGINYYIDEHGNVYNHEDVLSNKKNPYVIANYERDRDGNYHIPEFGI
tara:strand:+ start:2425 stop:2946 length:522 start_codon:yes stop_codon:yes gene_type:complete